MTIEARLAMIEACRDELWQLDMDSLDMQCHIAISEERNRLERIIDELVWNPQHEQTLR
jgi:hypothetical protein